MWAKRAKENIIASRSVTWGQMARRGFAIYGGAKSEREAAASEKNERTASAVHRRGCPWREGWRAVPPTVP
jgi:phage gp16-like protein